MARLRLWMLPSVLAMLVLLAGCTFRGEADDDDDNDGATVDAGGDNNDGDAEARGSPGLGALFALAGVGAAVGFAARKLR